MSPSDATQPHSADELRKLDAYRRACSYPAAGMMHLPAADVWRRPG